MLNWNTHISKLSTKVSKSIGILYKLKSFLPLYILKILYNSLILPHFLYGILVWGTNTNEPFKLQKKAVRVISNSTYNAHTSQYLKVYNY